MTSNAGTESQKYLNSKALNIGRTFKDDKTDVEVELKSISSLYIADIDYTLPEDSKTI